MPAQLSPRPPSPRLFPDILRSRAVMQPAAVALIVDGVGSMTFGEWDGCSNAFASGLAACGVHRGDRLGLLFDGGGWLDYAVAFFGALKAGAVSVPIPFGLPPAQIDEILLHSGATILCCPPELATRNDLCLPARDPADIAGTQARNHFQAPAEPGDLAQILYTSGTTGPPKGVACTHANLLFGIIADGPELAAARLNQVSLHALPIGVNAAQIELTRAAHRLASTVILPTFDPERIGALVAEHHATVLLLVPAMAIMMVNAGVFDRHDASPIRHLRLTGAPSPPALLRRLAEALPLARITNEYALTESSPTAITTTYAPARPDSVGRPGPAQLVRIIAETGEECRTGEWGEIRLCTPNAPMRSYCRDPQATSAVFGDGWIRTGDLGYLDDEGFLHVADRKADLIISGGHNISSLGVEAVLQECPAIGEAAVVGVPHDVLGEHVAAVVVLRSPTTGAAIKAFARDRLPGHAVPQTVLFLDRLPRGSSGKVLKAELRERLAAELAREFVPAATPTEEGVAAIWTRVLGLEEVSAGDRFVDLGGQSISALQVLAEVERRYGVRLELSVLAQAETVAALAAVVDTRLRSGTDERHRPEEDRTG